MISLLTGWRLHRTGKRMVGSRLKSADALKGEGDAQAPSNAEVAMNLLTSAKDKVKNEHGLGAIKDHPVLFAWLYPPAISALVAYWGLEPKSALGLCLGLAMLLLPGILFVAYAGSRDYKSSGGKLAGAIISTAKYVGGMLIFLFIFVSVVECSIHGCNP
jgi:hypothetical protein